MLILPDVFIFSVAHEQPPVIRLFFFGGGGYKGLCLSGLSCLVYSEKVRSFLVLSSSASPETVLNNLNKRPASAAGVISFI